jgi:hypothetical protein
VFAENSDVEKGILEKSRAVIFTLKKQDFHQLSQFAHPKKGIRFTPYAVDCPSDKDLTFLSAQIKNFAHNKKYYQWGKYDTGETIALSVKKYFNRFVFDKDFSKNKPRINVYQLPALCSVNFYANAYEVTYFSEGSSLSDGAPGDDWRELKLVFEKYNNAWYLVAVIHNEWAI